MKGCDIDQKHFHQIIRFCLFLVAFLQSGGVLFAQEDTIQMKANRPVKNTFESIWLMDNQTVMVPGKGTFELDFQHRFGTWEKGYDNFFGIFAPSNMRIGLDYVPTNNLMVGFGFTKQHYLWDVYGKYALLKQGRQAGSPVSLSYYVNAANERREENKNFQEQSDRWSFFHQVMIARKFSEDFSLQVSGNLSWFNFKDRFYDDQGTYLGRDKNEQFSASAMARYKLSNLMAVTVAYDLPITDQKFFNPEPNLSLGFEIVTSGHAFQVFVGNFQSIIPQFNHTFNSNSFGDNEILLGFNITKVWN